MKPFPKFIAVIHISGNQSMDLKQIEIALNNGAGGVFLIDHHRAFHTVLDFYLSARDEFPIAWIGANFLDLSPTKAAAVASVLPNFDALWLDDPGIHGPCTATDLSRLLEWFDFRNNTWAVFASVAFKYQGQCDNPAGVALTASELHEVVVTSGDKTGSLTQRDRTGP